MTFLNFSVERPSAAQPFRGATLEQARAKRTANIAVKAEGEGVAVVEVYDEIGGWGVYASELIPALREVDGEDRVVEIRINSGGGDVFEGVAIANALARMKARTIAVVDGLAASIASVIAVAADEVHMPGNAMMMIHRPWVIAWGESSKLRAAAAILDKIEVQLIDTYAAKAPDAPRADLEQMVADETWLTADEAIAIGLADVKIEGVKARASLDPEMAGFYSKAPDEIVAKADEEPQEEPVEEAADEEPEVEDDAAPEGEPVAEEVVAAEETIEAEIDEPRATPAVASADIPAEDDEIQTHHGGFAELPKGPVRKTQAQELAEIRSRQFASYYKGTN